ncbi:MAG: 3'-5' exonuclease [Albimonas sp.]|uniref:3'-5' exonuclease n=1 Tax=Albimonas sp. TaxID=1872425 RepID=UPI0040566FCF|tara:strand:- start:1753 stop:3345 length:1593 start_codon:yes stop_codon:yes gene_type:complete
MPIHILADHLPAEAAEALLNLAVGILPAPRTPAAPDVPADPYAHPDAQRRFRIMENREELEAALDAPWEAWTVFLHPSQRDFVDRDFNGPARVTGSAGTGKTVVALHRAVRMARRSPDEAVLLVTFTDALAAALRLKLRRLLGESSGLAARIRVRSLQGLAQEMHEQLIGPLEVASEPEVARALAAVKSAADAPFSEAFLLDEWNHVVDGWNIRDADAYARVPRLGRKTRVGGRQREVLWQVMADARARLEDRGLTTWSAAFDRLRPLVASKPPYTAVVVDEAQDLAVAELGFLVAAVASPDALFFAGDIAQRIFRQPFSWASLGVDIRGRSRVLKVNYRTSHQIRARADRLLPTELSDVDGNEESRRGVVSVFSGPEPEVVKATDDEHEVEAVANWIEARIAEGIAPVEIGLVVRTVAQAPRAQTACEAAGLRWRSLAGGGTPEPGFASICTMHLAKGLEFRAVAVLACDEDVVPLADRLEGAATEAELKEIYETERHLLYVACTRARDRLLVSGVEPVSEFVEDLCDK